MTDTTTTEQVHIDKIISFTKKVMTEYGEYCDSLGDSSGMSFGEWVMKTHYPDVEVPMSGPLRNMIVMTRTNNARTWFIANLRSGVLQVLC
jgi:hypothetical protein